MAAYYVRDNIQLLKISLHYNSSIKPIGNIYSIQCLTIMYELVELRYDYCLKWNYYEIQVKLKNTGSYYPNLPYYL